jgi:hypothetical protein
MQYIKILIVLMTYPPFFTGFLLILSWIIWILLRLFQRPHLALSAVFIFSASLLVTLFGYWVSIQNCPDLCATENVTLSYIAKIVFWFVIFYTPTKLILVRHGFKSGGKKNEAL